MKTAVIRRISAFIILVIFFFPAKAQIVYTDINPDTTISYGKEYDLDLNNDGITDFMFYSNLVGSQAPCYIVNFGITALNED